MTNSVAVSIVSEASPCSTAGPVGTKLCTFRWILDKIEVAMSHYSSKINYQEATYQSSLTGSTTVALHLSSEKFEDRFEVITNFPSLSFSIFS